MFEKVSVAITEVLEDKKIIQSSTKEVCAYGLRQIFSTIFNAGTMLLIGFLMQMLIDAFVNKKLSHLANKKVSQL